jgi:2'-5' RNA ligase
MQSICTLLPDELTTLVAEARALVAEEPSIGSIYDPPFAHFTLQLAEDYEWPRLEEALTQFARQEQPFEVRTVGLLTLGNGSTSELLIAPYLDENLRAFQERFWLAVQGTAQGNIRKFDYPGSFLPHITVKRCGTDHAAAGRAYAHLLEHSYSWTFMADNVSVMHDPGKNSRTHYLRMRFPLGGRVSAPAPVSPGHTNARIVEFNEGPGRVGATGLAITDDGMSVRQTWSAPDLVRLCAELKCSDVHFAGSRCLVDAGRIVAIEPKTPYPRLI